MRAELVPLLEQRFNPSIVDALADQAEIAREEWRWQTDAAERLSAAICRREGDRWRIDAEALNAAPPALSRDWSSHAAMTEAARAAGPWRLTMSPPRSRCVGRAAARLMVRGSAWNALALFSS